MNGKNIIEIIDSKWRSLSKSHKTVAEYIETNYYDAAYMTAQRLADQTGVSEPTIVRFATKLGYEGYPELQKDLNEYAKTRITAPQRIDVARRLINESDQEDMISHIIASDIDSLRKTMKMVSREDFNATVDALINARNIYIVGARSAYSLASFLDCNLSAAFPSVRLINDRTASGVFEQLFAVNFSDVVIGISFPRYTLTTVRAMRFANRRGATVVAMTDGDQSPLVKFATYKLYCHSDIVSYYDSLVSPLSVINALLAAISLRRKDDITETLQTIEEIYAENEIYEKHSKESSL